jgi:VIT1/CCC1 family predicted Fe2+/Mn2+ transporter
VPSPADDRERIARWTENLQDERDGVALYEGLAKLDKVEGRARAFKELAAAEQRHAAVWEAKLAAAGVTPKVEPSTRVKWLLSLARTFGTDSVLSLVLEAEAKDVAKYDRQPDAGALAAEEREHAEVLEELKAGKIPSRIDPLARERWHQSRAGSIRAAVFGINDGLVSNVSLVLGVAAADVAGGTVILTGVAGLLAGAFSMAVGEYVSVSSQRDILRRQIALEKAEIRDAPGEEKAELAALLVKKGVSPDRAARAAEEIFENPDQALDMLVREELGLDPNDLGSPTKAAIASFVMFTIGAILPLVPFFFTEGLVAAIASAGVCAVVLAAVSAFLAVLSGTSVVRGVVRMVGLAAIAAAVTVLVGRLVGVSLG